MKSDESEPGEVVEENLLLSKKITSNNIINL